MERIVIIFLKKYIKPKDTCVNLKKNYFLMHYNRNRFKSFYSILYNGKLILSFL